MAKRKKPQRNRKPWTQTDIEKLTGWAGTRTVAEVAKSPPR